MARVLTLLVLSAICRAAPSFLDLPQTYPQPAPVAPSMPYDPDLGSSLFTVFLGTLVVEARDKTFVLTGLYAASKMRRAIAAGALTSMFFLTIVNALIGYVFVPLIREGWVNWAAVIAYVSFFCLFVKEAWNNKPEDMPDSLKRPLLEQQNAEKEAAGNSNPPPASDDPPPPLTGPLLSPEERRARWIDLYVKSAALIFLGEWSDATMVSTSNFGQKNNFWGVLIGCMLAYTVTTTVAVFTGRWLGSKVKYRVLLFLTAVIFLLFAFFTVFY